MVNDRKSSSVATSALVAVLLCGRMAVAQPSSAASTTPVTPARVDSIAPEAGGQVIMIHVAPGGRSAFEPAEVSAHPGDVLRFVFDAAYHNVNFDPDRNPGAVGLPRASQMVTAPGQTYEVRVSFAPGVYRFVCDAHAGMGMAGRLRVQ